MLVQLYRSQFQYVHFRLVLQSLAGDLDSRATSVALQGVTVRAGVRCKLDVTALPAPEASPGALAQDVARPTSCS